MTQQKMQRSTTNNVQPDQERPRNDLRDLLSELDRNAGLVVKIDGRQFVVTANGIAAVVLVAILLACLLALLL